MHHKRSSLLPGSARRALARRSGRVSFKMSNPYLQRPSRPPRLREEPVGDEDGGEAGDDGEVRQQAGLFVAEIAFLEPEILQHRLGELAAILHEVPEAEGRDYEGGKAQPRPQGP